MSGSSVEEIKELEKGPQKYEQGMKTMKARDSLRAKKEDIETLMEMVDRIGVTKLKELMNIVEDLNSDVGSKSKVDNTETKKGCFSCFCC